MRIGVIADTHIPDRASDIPAVVLRELESVDMIIHAGDLIEPEVLEKLKAVCKNVKAVYGNMDPEAVRKRLPQKEIFKVGKFRIGIMHGWGHPDKLVELLSEQFKDDPPDIIVFGHSHKPMNEKRNNVLFFNPGSVTDKVFAPYNSFGIIEINDTIKARIIRI